MKSYLKPLISAVELDSKQAVLQVCNTGGIYFDYVTGGAGWCVYAGDVDPRPRCFATPKGGAGGGTGGDHDVLSLPS